MKIILSLVALCLVPAVASAQNVPPQDPILGENTVKVSDHVWAIMGWPNIGIVVGENATLVVDTGLGPRNGATAARVAKKLAPNNKLYLTTTHFHPEHAGGVSGFPAGTVLIRPKVQQDEMDKHGEEMIHLFESRYDQWRELLTNVKLRAPDKTFDKDLKLDLGGGVTARLLWFGGAHTKGDELTFVEPDKTLISGDVVQNKVVPNIYRRRRYAFELDRGSRSGGKTWRRPRAADSQPRGRRFAGGQGEGLHYRPADPRSWSQATGRRRRTGWPVAYRRVQDQVPGLAHHHRRRTS